MLSGHPSYDQFVTEPDADKVVFTHESEYETARHLLWLYGHPNGYRPGSFHQAFMVALDRADPINRARLLSTFPEFLDPYTVLYWFGPETLATVLDRSLARKENT